MARKSRKISNNGIMNETSKNAVTENKTAIYLRLSAENNGDTIDNQEIYIRKYLEKIGGINVIKVYKDNGFSGTNFNRYGWEELMSDLYSKKINCIAVKDFSRLGRNFLETGNLLEKVFPFMNVRFISVNDNYDSENTVFSRSMLEVSFKNLMNELFVRDIARKIKTNLDTRKAMGYIAVGSVPYGYDVSADGKSLVLNPETAPVVRKIFEWRLLGKAKCEIARLFNELAIISPGRYRFLKSDGKKFKRQEHSKWIYQNITDILRNRVYIGDLVRNRATYSIFREKRIHKNDVSEWIITENAHIAIVTKEMFEKAQALENPKPNNPTPKYPLKGKVYCGKCGYHLKRNYYKNLSCQTHYRKIKENCNICVRDTDVLNVIRETVNKYIEIFTDKNVYLEKFTKLGLPLKLKELQNDKEKLVYKQSENARCIADLYSDLKKGLICAEDFAFFREKYKADNNIIDKSLENIEDEIKRYSNTNDICASYKQKVEDLNSCLDDDYRLMSLVNKIEVFSKEEIKIHFNFLDGFEKLLEYGENSEVTEL